MLKGLILASHFGPTMAVTLVSFLLATNLWWEGPAFVIAFGVFLGQLLVGYTNDLYDFAKAVYHLLYNGPYPVPYVFPVLSAVPCGLYSYQPGPLLG